MPIQQNQPTGKLAASASSDMLQLSNSEQLQQNNKLFQAQIQPHSTKDANLQQQQILAS